jgi:hypothetical protein
VTGQVWRGSRAELSQPQLPGGCRPLWEAGVREVTITGPVALSAAEPVPSLRLLRFLREAACYGIAVRWHVGAAGLDMGLPLLHHLPAPASPSVPGWAASYRYGLCYYRQGPDFLAVHDARFITVRRHLLQGQERDAFLRCSQPTIAGPLDRPLRWLVDQGLILRLGDMALSLPYRLRRWPIPCTSL